MVYLLEFYAIEGDAKRVVGSMTHRAKSVERASNHAKSLMKNVKFEDRTAQLCQVKDQMGNILVVVPADKSSRN